MRIFFLESTLPIFPIEVERKEGKYKIQVQCDEVRDEYHSFHELYQHRMALNIALFHMLYEVDRNLRGAYEAGGESHKVMKSKLHNDGTMFDGYFIVMAVTPLGQISYHYKLHHWDLFRIPEVERTPPWDGHSSMEVIERLIEL